MELIKPELGPLIWMLISFGIVFFILAKFAWKPILTALRYRERTIERRLLAAKRAKEELAKIEFGNEKITALAKLERENMLKEAQKIKDSIIQEAKAEAREEYKKIINETRKGIEKEKQQAVDQIKREIATLSVDIAQSILKERLADKGNQTKLIEKLVKDIKIN